MVWDEYSQRTLQLNNQRGLLPEEISSYEF